jgi:hypothetical protein
MLARILFALFAAVTMPLGLWIAYNGGLAAVEAEQSAAWPSAKGQVTASHVRVSVSHGRHGSHTSYTPVIYYTYAVGWTTYTGTVVTPGRLWGSKSAYAAVNSHPVGVAQVHYDPAHPSTSTLEMGLHPANFGQFVIGLLVATFGALFWLVAVNLQPSGDGRSSTIRRDTAGGRMVLPLVGLLAAEVVALVCLS